VDEISSSNALCHHIALMSLPERCFSATIIATMGITTAMIDTQASS
jgi:hypothetical protein